MSVHMKDKNRMNENIDPGDGKFYALVRLLATRKSVIRTDAR